MRRLNREVEPPEGLRRYRHGRDQWSSITLEHRQGIWDKLDAMQGKRCAYCEADINHERRHIEHFRQRDRYPQGTFDWHNLFGSCNRTGTCGKLKDNCGLYHHEDLIKPDIEDPEAFLVFTPNGSVQPRANLSARDRNRAEQTIRILGLNGALTQIRLEQIRGHLDTAVMIAELAEEYPEDEWLPFLADELTLIIDLPFATAIKHVLTPQNE
ncbi:retron Ec78 anti-phage system effector HNH endonuclease PtuB [Pseudomonas faucium]|uniref:retron Ec78 anti-phage system effector HNH endonuclease PtuB n=1 Tax=Pseudomonas faucium TaxID=2740518 RepID=UPI0015967134|nr:retron Ec78 anti-phage system effector HNH endonuclease PtuB [Pseudomonas faucium]